jgi:hypothetical protein
MKFKLGTKENSMTSGEILKYSRSKLGKVTRPFLILVVTLTVISLSTNDHNAQTRRTLSVRDPRPVAKAVEMLEARCHCVITYEDPQYAYPGDLADVTEKVSKNLDQFKPGQAPRVIIPKEGTLTFDYTTVPGSEMPTDIGVAVDNILASHAGNSNGARFRMEMNGRLIHVVPDRIRNKPGRLIKQQSILESLITIVPKERTGLETLQAICAALSSATHTPVNLATIPMNVFLNLRNEGGFTRLKARDALVKTLERTGIPLSWQLLYNSTMKSYFLNIHPVRPTG